MGLINSYYRNYPPINLNSLGIYLTCDLNDGLSKCTNMSGKIYVIGQPKNSLKFGTLTANRLWGMMNMIWDSMDNYSDTGDGKKQIKKWSKQFMNSEWEPLGSRGGVDIYNDDPTQE